MLLVVPVEYVTLLNTGEAVLPTIWARSHSTAAAASRPNSSFSLLCFLAGPPSSSNAPRKGGQ